MQHEIQVNQLACGYGDQAWWLGRWHEFVADLPAESVPDVTLEWPHRDVRDERWGHTSGLVMTDDPDGMLNPLFFARQRAELLSFEDLYVLARAPWNAQREGVDVGLFNRQGDEPIVWWPAIADLEPGDLVLADMAPRETFDPQRLAAGWWERLARSDAEFVARTDRLRKVTYPGLRSQLVHGGLIGLCRVREKPWRRGDMYEVNVDRFIPFPHELRLDGLASDVAGTAPVDVRTLPEILGAPRGAATDRPDVAPQRWDGSDAADLVRSLLRFDWSRQIGTDARAERDVAHFKESLERLLDDRPALLPRYLGTLWRSGPATARRRRESDADAFGAITLRPGAAEAAAQDEEHDGLPDLPSGWTVVATSPPTRTGQDPASLLPATKHLKGDGTRITFIFDAVLQGDSAATIAERLRGTLDDVFGDAMPFPTIRLGPRHVAVVVPYEDADVGMEETGRLRAQLDESHSSGGLLTKGASPHAGASDKLRVLVIATEWHSREGGISTLNRGLCKALAQAGADVECFVGPKEDAKPEDAHPVLLTRVRTVSGQTDDGAVREALGRQQPTITPDVVIGHGHITGGLAHAVADALASPVVRVHVVHTRPLHVGNAKAGESSSSAVAAGEKKLQAEIANVERADIVCGVGPNLHKEALGLVAMCDDGTAVPFQIVPAIEEDIPVRKQPIGLREVVYTMGRVKDPSKGTRTLVEAMQRLERERDDVELQIRGVPAEGADAEKADLKRQLNRVLIRPYETDASVLARDLKVASVMCMTSHEEGFGLVALEAINRGVPVLVDGRSGIATLLRELDPGDTAIVDTDPEKPAAAWEEKIRAVLDHPTEQHQRALDRRKRILDHKTWAQTGQELMNLLLAKSNELKGS